MKNRYYEIVLVAIACQLFIGCRSKLLSPAAYAKAIGDGSCNNTSLVKTTGFNYEFKVMPAEFIAITEQYNAGGLIDINILKSRLAEISGFTYVKLRIINNKTNQSVLQVGATTEAQVQERTNYYYFKANRDLWATCGKDTLLPSDYQFEENYNLSNEAVISIVFPKCAGNQLTIHFNDQAAGNYDLSTALSTKDFPQLKLN